MYGWPHWALTLPAAPVLDTRTPPDAELQELNAYSLDDTLETYWRNWFLVNWAPLPQGRQKWCCTRNGSWATRKLCFLSGTDSARLIGSGLRIPTMKILGGNKGALRIPSLSFQLLRRPGCTAKLLCFHIAGGFAPHRLFDLTFGSVRTYIERTGAIRGQLNRAGRWNR